MKKYADVVQTTTGDAVAGASVEVLTYPGAVAATLYSDDGVTPIANPVSTDASGMFSFYTANGHYSLVISGASITTITLDDVLIVDDGPSGDLTLNSIAVTTTAVVGTTANFATINVSGASNLAGPTACSTITASGAVVLASTLDVGAQTTLANIAVTTSAVIGAAASSLVSFHGVTASVQVTAATSATTTGVATGGVGFASTAQLQASVDAINACVAALKAKGLMAP